MAIPAFRALNNYSECGNDSMKIEWPRDDEDYFVMLEKDWLAVLVVTALPERPVPPPVGWEPLGHKDVISGGCPKWQHHFARRDFVAQTEIAVGGRQGASAIIAIVGPAPDQPSN